MIESSGNIAIDPQFLADFFQKLAIFSKKSPKNRPNFLGDFFHKNRFHEKIAILAIYRRFLQH
jgi:hypothetical protein